MQVISTELNVVVGELLQKLLFWQERAKALTPLKAQKRLLSGLRCSLAAQKLANILHLSWPRGMGLPVELQATAGLPMPTCRIAALGRPVVSSSWANRAVRGIGGSCRDHSTLCWSYPNLENSTAS